ncbi:hypothetical protein B0H16DRAFT_1456787 [Mycena metata]|uniref:Uncharacterized protein n=1 Tax=Mycena metata TaxID=1033252 RepID=A0AAD7JCJ9_9AGAR|nr:hypothetical protein B0H16DRAFT_1456787 [Mycena metata]
MDRGVEGTALIHRKQSKASDILDSPLFSTLNMAKHTRKEWFDMIVRKFTNYRNQTYLKQPEHASLLPAIESKKANPLLKFSSVVSGRQLFAQENEESLNAASKKRVLDSGSQSFAGVYQVILKDRWDSLTGEEQSNKQHPSPDSEDLLAGTWVFLWTPSFTLINFAELESMPWSDFAEDAIPRLIKSNPSIPRNASGQPVFPSINLDNVPSADLRTLLCEYFDQYWLHRSCGTQMKSVPWADIAANPHQHYDTAGNFFPIKLAHPQNLSGAQVVTLAEGLLSTSVIDSPTPFCFLEGGETVLVPATPPIPPVNLLSSDPPPPLPSAPIIQAPPPAEPVNPPPPSSPKLREESQNAGLAGRKHPGDKENPADCGEPPVKKPKKMCILTLNQELRFNVGQIGVQTKSMILGPSQEFQEQVQVHRQEEKMAWICNGGLGWQ